MSTTLYVEQENGNLKLIAEVEGIDNPALAVDALLDDAPRLKDREFVAIVGEGNVGTAHRVTVDSDEPVNPKRSMTVLGGGAGEDAADEEPKPARRQQRRKPAAKAPARKPAAKKTPARKTPAKKAAAPKPKPRKPAAKKAGGKSPFNKSTKGDE